MQGIGVLTGKTLGDYLLGAPLGDDGFGPIYQAAHQNLKRAFALRVLSDRFTFASGFESLFWHMAQVVAALEHPNLLTLDDYGIDGPYVYLVTPFVEGISLEHWLRQRASQPTGRPGGAGKALAVAPAQVTRLFGQALTAFHHAHQAGVTHLGLTAQHLLLEPNGRLMVANFGLSYLAEHLWIAWNGRRSFGDPRYLAPEQFPGRTPSGPASDIYSLGIILYRLLTGALPYDGAPPAILAAKLEGPPSLRAAMPALPPMLEEVVRRALAPNPEDRWPDIATFGGAFHLALEGSGHAPPKQITGSMSRLALPAPLAAPAAAEGGPPGRQGPAIVSSTIVPMLPGNYVNPGHMGQPAPGVKPPLQQKPAAPPAQEAAQPAITWSSAGRGRAVPPPAPPGWGTPGWREPTSYAAPQKPRSPLRRLISIVVRTTIVLLTLGALGAAIFYGYNRWSHIQPAPDASPTPIGSPTGSPTPPSPSGYRLTFPDAE